MSTLAECQCQNGVEAIEASICAEAAGKGRAKAAHPTSLWLFACRCAPLERLNELGEQLLQNEVADISPLHHLGRLTEATIKVQRLARSKRIRRIFLDTVRAAQRQREQALDRAVAETYSGVLGF